MKTKNTKVQVVILFISLALFTSSCDGTKAAGNETWSLVKLLSQGEKTSIETDTVYVKNCNGNVENKEVSCSAGTSSDLTIGLSGDVGASFGVEGHINAEISSTLGIGRDSGETLALDSPPANLIYEYSINKTYKVITGDALISSISGEERTASYVYQASCSLEIISRREANCPATTGGGSTSPTRTPVSVSIATRSPTEKPKTSASQPRMYNFEACSSSCNGNNDSRTFSEGISTIYVKWNYENIPYGADYQRVWKMNGKEWIRYSCTWTGSENGIDSVKLTEPYGLYSGTWEMTIYIDGQVVMREEIKTLGNHTYWDPAGTLYKCHGLSN